MQTNATHSGGTDSEQIIALDPRYRKICLLREYRNLKDQLIEQSIREQKMKIEQILSDTRQEVYSNDNVLHTILGVLSKLSNSSKNTSTFNPNTLRSFEYTPHNKSTNKHLDHNYITQLTELIQLLLKSYRISGEEEFKKLCTQLMEALDVLKDYKCPGDSVHDLQQKFFEISSLATNFKLCFKN